MRKRVEVGSEVSEVERVIVLHLRCIFLMFIFVPIFK